MKHKGLVFFAFIVMASVFASLFGCCHPPLVSSLNVELIPQHRDCWCWAATTEMISKFYGHKIDQCDSANYVHGTPPDCCTGCQGNCPCWGWGWGATINDVKNNWTHWHFNYTYKTSSLSWKKLKATIASTRCCGKSPIQAV
ncbi:MAG: hypothetical protein LWW94_10325 [Candidatus Desulfofervidaceae bacterium]|nr:hypothetical protein [Candidatus Desulfofervidaceae bacterium]